MELLAAKCAAPGGMLAFRWNRPATEIVEAFTLLGYLPPVRFCRLAAMSGRGTSEHDRYLMLRKELSHLRVEVAELRDDLVLIAQRLDAHIGSKEGHL